MLTRPGSNFSTSHLTDATSGGSYGYGGFVPQAYNDLVAKAVGALPGVAAAKLALTNQGGQSYDAMRQSIQDAIINLGDGSIASGLQAIDPRTGLKTSVLDPNTAGLANTNTGVLDKTVGADRNQRYGNSVIARLKLAADQALQQKLGELGGLGTGTQASGGWGVARNLANIDYGQKAYQAHQDALGTITGAINTQQGNQTTLSDKYANALLSGNQTVGNAVLHGHGAAYGLPPPQYNVVGGGAVPNGPGQSVSPYPQTSSVGFKAAPGGPGALPYRTGALPAPPLPKPPAAPHLGHVT